jgi:hypothetical protein
MCRTVERIELLPAEIAHQEATLADRRDGSCDNRCIMQVVPDRRVWALPAPVAPMAIDMARGNASRGMLQVGLLPCRGHQNSKSSPDVAEHCRHKRGPNASGWRACNE